MPAAQTQPAWVTGASPAGAFVRGLAVMFTTPGMVLFLTALGFGTLVRDAGMTLGHALFLSFAIYALPAQVMMVDQFQRGASLLAVAFAVSLTAVRLLPMTVSLLPYIRARGGSRAVQLLAVHFIAITAWIEGNRRLPLIPQPLRVAHFIGIGLGMVAATASGGAVGFTVAARIPPMLQTALLFMTPVYFMLSTIAAAANRRDWIALLLGGALAPLIFIWMPNVDLLIAGLVGGTVAYWFGRTPA